MKKIIITTSWDDGDPMDNRLAEMLAKYSVPATFYLPIDNVERKCLNSQEIKRIACNFDIGGHTYHHTDLTGISLNEANNEIRDGKHQLEDLTGRPVSSFSYPFGRYNSDTIKMVRESGFIGARTVQLHTRHISNPFKTGTMVHAKKLPFTRHLLHPLKAKDFNLLGFIIKKNLYLKDWDRIAIETLEFVIKNGGIWHLWGHSWEIAANNDWGKLASIFRMIEKLPPDILKISNTQLLSMHSDEAGISDQEL